MIATYLRTIFSCIFVGIIGVFFAFPGFIILIIPWEWRYTTPWCFSIVYWFYNAIVYGSLLPITFEGLEHVSNEPVIFVANHQSSLDIPLLGALTKGRSHIWLAKKELTEHWFFRFVLPRIGVLVDMEHPMKAMRSLLQTVAIAQKYKCHIMLFPEGGRFTDDIIHPFFGGFGWIARKTEYPIVPVCIIGANKVYPPDSYLIHAHKIRVVVGPSFVYTEAESEEAFKQRVYDWFVTTLQGA